MGGTCIPEQPDLVDQSEEVVWAALRLERPAVVLVVDGFHEGVQPSSVMYTGMSRARDLLVVVGPRDVVARALGEASMRRLTNDRV